MRRLFLFLAGLIFPAALSLASETDAEPTGGRPNVVLIVIDTLRADHLGHLGYERNTSPNIDDLARRSVAFDNAISPAPWTNPAVAAIFTGLHPSALGISRDAARLPADLLTLPGYLKQRGYRTAGFISHTFIGRKYAFDAHFDSWDQSNARGHQHVSSAAVTDKVLDWLGKRGPQPFFVFAHYFDPHWDYLQHSGHRFGEPYHGTVRSSGNNMGVLRKRVQRGDMSEVDLRHLRDLYDSEIAFVDEHLGRLFAWMREQGLFEDALIVLTADHGETFAERPSRWLGHTRYLYPELIRVPLLIKPPRLGAGRQDHRYVSTVDIPRTVVGQIGAPSAGAPSPPGCDLLADSCGGPVYSETRRDADLQAVIHDGWKLTRDLTSGKRELYRLDADRHERDDRSELAEGKQKLPELSRRLEAWSEHNASAGKPAAVKPKLSDRDIERLRLLGYVDDERDPDR